MRYEWMWEMIMHSREWRPQTIQEWWDALYEGDKWASDNGWLLSSASGYLPVQHGMGNWSPGFLSVVAIEKE